MKRLSQSEREFVTNRVFFWQKVLGQISWSIRVCFTDKAESRAECECRSNDRIAVITFSKEFDEEWDDNDLDETAFHEVEEIKYWMLRDFLAEELVDTLIHELIRLDENTIFQRMKHQEV